MITIIEQLFRSWAGEDCHSIQNLSAHGSNRAYYRLQGKQRSCLAAFNENVNENRAFINFTQSFKEHHLPAPEIYAVDKSEKAYLLEDLGDLTLYEFLVSHRKEKGFDNDLLNVYSKVLDSLILFQLKGKDIIDFSYCYPRSAFDEQSMLWDLNYFKYYFLKLADIPFDEQSLENDFHEFIRFLKQADSNYFLYRDFQSRNIMLVDGDPYFIDYQGGRKGALQYDLASLLYDAKAEIPQSIRQQLLDEYMQKLSAHIHIDKTQFTQLFYGFVFIRIMQAMGTYGFRGFYERKTHFLKSIPPAINNLKWLLENIKLPVALPALQKIWEQLCSSQKLLDLSFTESPSNVLTVSINSFAYKNGIPLDNTGNEGGYVFDCRALPNPGRFPEYKSLTGKDNPVIEFLEKEPEVAVFLENVSALVSQSIETYQKRNFTHLMINFGCTGGQHRSVYCAEYLTRFILKKYDCLVNLKHQNI